MKHVEGVVGIDCLVAKDEGVATVLEILPRNNIDPLRAWQQIHDIRN